MRLSKLACSAAAAAPRGAGLAAAAAAAIAPSAEARPGVSATRRGVEREEAVDVPGEAGFGGGVRLALRKGGEPLEGDDDGAGAGRLGGGDHGALGAQALGVLGAVEHDVGRQHDPEAHAERERRRPREQAVGGGAGQELGFAGHGAGR